MPPSGLSRNPLSPDLLPPLPPHHLSVLAVFARATWTRQGFSAARKTLMSKAGAAYKCRPSCPQLASSPPSRLLAQHPAIRHVGCTKRHRLFPTPGIQMVFLLRRLRRRPLPPYPTRDDTFAGRNGISVAKRNCTNQWHAGANK
jgi:hypothetical protein